MAASLVQFTLPANSSISNGSTLALGSNVTAGNALIVITAWYDGCPPSIADTQGNTWTRTRAASGYFVLTAVAGSSGANTLTFSSSCGTNNGMVYAEVSGLQASPFDKFNSNSSTSSPVTTGSITPSTNGQYIMATFVHSIGDSYSVASPFALHGSFGGGGLGQFADYVQPTAGAIAATPTVTGVSGSYPVTGAIWSFKATVSASVNSNFLMFM